MNKPLFLEVALQNLTLSEMGNWFPFVSKHISCISSMRALKNIPPPVREAEHNVITKPAQSNSNEIGTMPRDCSNALCRDFPIIIRKISKIIT